MLAAHHPVGVVEMKPATTSEDYQQFFVCDAGGQQGSSVGIVHALRGLRGRDD
jgi:hypothetical protein